jgi:hypothetical protein
MKCANKGNKLVFAGVPFGKFDCGFYGFGSAVSKMHLFLERARSYFEKFLG